MKTALVLALGLFVSSFAQAEVYHCGVQKIENGTPTESLANFSIDTTIDPNKTVSLSTGDAVSCVVFQASMEQLTCIFAYEKEGPSAASSIEVGANFFALQVLSGPRPTLVYCSKEQ